MRRLTLSASSHGRSVSTLKVRDSREAYYPSAVGDAAGGAPSRVNEHVWSRGSLVRAYASRVLRPPEVMLLLRYRDELRGRVLELGCGAGRITGYLLAIGADVHGIDLSKAMIEYCRRRYPAGTFEIADLRDLRARGDSSYDVVVAGFNVIDVLDDAERRRVLDEVRRVLRGGGLLIVSSHNRAYVSRVRPPTRIGPARDPVHIAADVVRMPWRVYNSRRLRPLERREEKYAIVNDEAHDYRLLHYYIGRDDQAAQLADLGYTLEECLDLDGRVVVEGETAAESSELHYAARSTKQS